MTELTRDYPLFTNDISLTGVRLIDETECDRGVADVELENSDDINDVGCCQGTVRVCRLDVGQNVHFSMLIDVQPRPTFQTVFFIKKSGCSLNRLRLCASCVCKWMSSVEYLFIILSNN